MLFKLPVVQHFLFGSLLTISLPELGPQLDPAGNPMLEGVPRPPTAPAGPPPTVRPGVGVMRGDAAPAPRLLCAQTPTRAAGPARVAETGSLLRRG